MKKKITAEQVTLSDEMLQKLKEIQTPSMWKKDEKKDEIGHYYYDDYRITPPDESSSEFVICIYNTQYSHYDYISDKPTMKQAVTFVADYEKKAKY